MPAHMSTQMSVHMPTQVYANHVCTHHAFTNIYTHACPHAYIHAYTHGHPHVYANVCTDVNMHVYATIPGILADIVAIYVSTHRNTDACALFIDFFQDLVIETNFSDLSLEWPYVPNPRLGISCLCGDPPQGQFHRQFCNFKKQPKLTRKTVSLGILLLLAL